jgi:hypothetical protein
MTNLASLTAATPPIRRYLAVRGLPGSGHGGRPLQHRCLRSLELRRTRWGVFVQPWLSSRAEAAAW